MSEVRNSHYVSRFLTSAWEGRDRRLYFVDLATKTLGNEPSKTLFALEGLHTTETERRLSRLVEDPLGKFRKNCIAAGDRFVMPDERAARALIGMISLQAQRTREAMLPGRSVTKLDELLANETDFQSFIDVMHRDYELIGATVNGPGEWISFPSLGWFAIPVLDELPVMAVPLSIRTFAALVPRTVNVERQLEGIIRTPSMLAACSMSGGGANRKIVIPAPIALAYAERPQELVDVVLGMRANGRKLFNKIAEMADIAGLRAFRYDDEADP